MKSKDEIIREYKKKRIELLSYQTEMQNLRKQPISNIEDFQQVEFSLKRLADNRNFCEKEIRFFEHNVLDIDEIKQVDQDISKITHICKWCENNDCTIRDVEDTFCSGSVEEQEECAYV